MRTIIMTGVTGFIGSHFALNFIGNEVDNVIAIVRGGSPEERQRKVLDALGKADDSYRVRHDLTTVMESITIIEGDITKPLAGVSAEALEILTQQDQLEVWHFAASLNYEDSRRHAIELANLTGTKNIMDLARAANVSRFVYCSTAYTCGVLEGDIEATWHDPLGGFNNHYERTKCEAEHYLKSQIDESVTDGLQLVILRPSVVIGNSATKKVGGSDSGLYGILREFGNIRHLLASPAEKVRMWVSCDSSINFIPIDELIRQLRIVIDAVEPAQKYAVKHLVSAGSPTNREILEIAQRQLGANSLEINENPLANMTDLETFIDQRTEFYRSYFRADRKFIPSVDDAGAVGALELEQFIEEALKSVDR